MYFKIHFDLHFELKNEFNLHFHLQFTDFKAQLAMAGTRHHAGRLSSDILKLCKDKDVPNYSARVPN